MIESLLILVVWLIIIGVIFYVLWWGISQIPMAPPIATAVRVLLVLVLVLILVYMLLGVLPSPHTLHWR